MSGGGGDTTDGNGGRNDVDLTRRRPSGSRRSHFQLMENGANFFLQFKNKKF